MIRPDFSHGARCVEQQADAIFKTAAVFVRAMIHERREKFAEQVTVRRVQLQPFKARRQRAFRGGDKIILHAEDVCLGHGARDFCQRITERDCARRNRGPAALRLGQMRAAVPRQIGGRLAARVRDLNARHRAVRLYKFRDACERRDVFFAPETEAARRDAAFRRNRRGLDDDESRAADRARAEMHKMPVIRHAVRGRILAHRRHADAVAQRHGADGQRLKQMRREVQFIIHSPDKLCWNKKTASGHVPAFTTGVPGRAGFFGLA